MQKLLLAVMLLTLLGCEENKTIKNMSARLQENQKILKASGEELWSDIGKVSSFLASDFPFIGGAADSASLAAKGVKN